MAGAGSNGSAGAIIATRTLTVTTSGESLDVPVRLFAPERHQAGWCCRYEIDWPEERRASAGWGLDAVQALHLTLQKIGIDLYMSEHHASGRLAWEAPGQGYGFPLPHNARDLLVGEDRCFGG